jgi:hypothetical protein
VIGPLAPEMYQNVVCSYTVSFRWRRELYRKQGIVISNDKNRFHRDILVGTEVLFGPYHS